MKTRAVVIAGAGSGTGKTTLTLGLMAALKKKGLAVQGFKSGPDYIDPSLHRIVTGKPSINLDTWMMPENFFKRSFASRAVQVDISVIEGVMGLYDGRDADSPKGSTAQLAKELNVPIILIVNAASMARTAAAIVQGLINFDPEITVMGIVFNQVGSPGHLKILEQAVATYCTVPVLGGIYQNPELNLPSRHLGLFMGEDGVLGPEKIAVLEQTVSENVDLNHLWDLAEIEIPDTPLFSDTRATSRKKAAVARDNAFCFYYEDNLRILEHLEYDIIYFSPINDTVLPKADFYYFGGGYPELYARALSENYSMRQSVLQYCKYGAYIYAECGGLMYLGETLTTVSQNTYSMCGCFPYATVMQEKLQSLGYTEIEVTEDVGIIKNRQTPLKGHCFHYSQLIFNKGAQAAQIYKGRPQAKAKGYRIHNTLTSYVHLHFSSLLEP